MRLEVSWLLNQEIRLKLLRQHLYVLMCMLHACNSMQALHAGINISYQSGPLCHHHTFALQSPLLLLFHPVGEASNFIRHGANPSSYNDMLMTCQVDCMIACYVGVQGLCLWGRLQLCTQFGKLGLQLPQVVLCCLQEGTWGHLVSSIAEMERMKIATLRTLFFCVLAISNSISLILRDAFIPLQLSSR